MANSWASLKILDAEGSLLEGLQRQVKTPDRKRRGPSRYVVESVCRRGHWILLNTLAGDAVIFTYVVVRHSHVDAWVRRGHVAMKRGE